MFASQLGATAGEHISAIQYSAIYYYAIDTNGNKRRSRTRSCFGLGNVGYYGFDPLNPTRLTTINQIGDYKTPKTHELMFGIDHELMPNFGISGTFTFRHFDHVQLDPAHRRDVCRLHADRHADRQRRADRRFQHAVLRASIRRRCRPAAAAATRSAQDYTSASWASRSAPSSGCRTAGWRASGSPPTATRNTSTVPSAIEDPTPTPASAEERRRRWSSPRPRAAARAASSWCCRSTSSSPTGCTRTLGHQPRRQLGAAAGLRDALLPEQRARPAIRSRATRACWSWTTCREFRLPAVSSLDVRIEKAFKINRVNLLLDLDVFNLDQQRDRARPPVQPAR